MTGEIRFQRANFLVQNIEVALRFYVDVLGLKLEFIKDSPEDSYSYEVFEIPRNLKIRFAVLSTADQVRVMALTEVPVPPPPHIGPRQSAIVIDSPEFDTVVEGARALGLKMYEEDRLVTHDGRVGRELGIVDKDNNLVVIYTIPENQ